MRQILILGRSSTGFFFFLESVNIYLSNQTPKFLSFEIFILNFRNKVFLEESVTLVFSSEVTIQKGSDMQYTQKDTISEY